MQALSSCSEWGLLSSCPVQASYCSGFSCCEAGTLGTQALGSTVVTHGLCCSAACGSVQTVQKNPYVQDNHDGVITDLEPDILECEVMLFKCG